MHAFIFDLDGTLVESLPGIAKALNTALAEHQLPGYTQQEVVPFIGDGSYALCQKAAPQQPAEQIRSIEASFKTHYTRFWRDGTSPFEGIPDLLQRLQQENIPIAILSNKPDAFTKEIVATLFPFITFTSVMGQTPLIAKKPDPAGVYEIKKDFPASSTIYLVGDSSVDLATAQRANIRSIAVTWGYEDSSALEGACHTCETIPQLRSLIEGLIQGEQI